MLWTLTHLHIPAFLRWLGSLERSSLRRLTRRSTARKGKERSAPVVIDSDNRSSVAFIPSVSSVCHSRVCRYFHLHSTESFSKVSKTVWRGVLIALCLHSHSVTNAAAAAAFHDKYLMDFWGPPAFRLWRIWFALISATITACCLLLVMCSCI